MPSKKADKSKSVAAAPVSGEVRFAPYGWLPQGLAEDLSNAGMLGRFRNEDGTPATPAQWVAWLDDHADDLASFLWPRWIKGAWSVDPSTVGEALTRADLKLMPELNKVLDQEISGTDTTHRVLFESEDDDPPGLDNLLKYLPAVAPALRSSFERLLIEGGFRLAAPTSLQLKQRMQRPRPYQTALLLQPDMPFRYEVAHTATTPAMVSGHCLQGAMALVNIVVRLEFAIGSQLDRQSLGELQRFLIDGGDRRVFAGVHYPSDNLSSWFTALRLCRRLVFDSVDSLQEINKQRSRAREVLWAAICDASQVFAAMARSQDPAFVQPLTRLRGEASDALG